LLIFLSSNFPVRLRNLPLCTFALNPHFTLSAFQLLPDKPCRLTENISLILRHLQKTDQKIFCLPPLIFDPRALKFRHKPLNHWHLPPSYFPDLPSPYMEGGIFFQRKGPSSVNALREFDPPVHPGLGG